MPWMPHTNPTSERCDQAAAVARQRAVVRLSIVGDAPAPRTFAFDVAARSSLHLGPSLACRQDGVDCLRERTGAPCLEEDAGLAVADELAVTSHIRRDEHPALRHGLERLQ